MLFTTKKTEYKSSQKQAVSDMMFRHLLAFPYVFDLLFSPITLPYYSGSAIRVLHIPNLIPTF